MPGWLDKGLKHRHGAAGVLDNRVLMAPHPDGVQRLPWPGRSPPGPRPPLRPAHWPTRPPSGGLNPPIDAFPF